MKVSNFNKVLLSLIVITLFVGLSCASAAVAINDNGNSVNDTFTMSARYSASTGYLWRVSPESTGVELINTYYKVDAPYPGGGGTAYFTFKVCSEHGVAKINLISPTGKIVDTMEQEF